MAPAAAWSRSRSRPGRTRYAAADAVVHEAQFGVAFQGVARDPLHDRLKLAGDRVLLGLLFSGDPGVDRHAEIVIGHGWSSSPGL